MRFISRPVAPRSNRHPRLRGFTLVELIIVVGIIALLTSLSLVGLTIARRNAQKVRVRSDLSLIATALEAYRDQFHDYPRFPDPADDQAALNANQALNGTWLDYASDRGARLLCQALISPGPAYTTKAGVFGGQDGADGPGFRGRVAAAGSGGGKIYGPFLASDKFKLEYDAKDFINMQDAKILDIFGNPILYFPAQPGPPGITLAGGFVASSPAQSPLAGNKPYYNGADNTADTSIVVNGKAKPLLDPTQMAFLMGDANLSGAIDGSESAVTTMPYLLWTAGPDGQFGFGQDSAGLPKSAGTNSSQPFAGLKSDDITNFTIPPGLQK